MADMGYGCVFGDCRQQVNHLITTISPPSSVSLCDEHYAPGLIPLLAAELGVDPGDFYTNTERFLDREAKKAERAVADAQAAESAKGSGGPAPAGDDQHQDDDGPQVQDDGPRPPAPARRRSRR